MTFLRPIDIFTQRPAQKRSLSVQAAELGLDPSNKSPVEAKLGYALLDLILDPDYFGPPGFANLFLPHGTIGDTEDMPPTKGRKLGVITIAPGCWVGNYQSDYFIEAKAPGTKCVACGTVECDGHKYHDRTPEQASHDRARDRYFQDMGITVLRFTASNIHENAKNCAHEALSILLRKSVNGHGTR